MLRCVYWLLGCAFYPRFVLLAQLLLQLKKAPSGYGTTASGLHGGLAAIATRRMPGPSSASRSVGARPRTPSLSFLGNLSPDFCYLKGGDMEPFALSQKLEEFILTGERK